MIHRDQGDLKAEEIRFINFPSKFCDALGFQAYLRKNIRSRVSAKRDNNFRFDNPYLLVEIRRTSFNLPILGVTVFWRPTLQNVSDENFFSRKPNVR